MKKKIIAAHILAWIFYLGVPLLLFSGNSNNFYNFLFIWAFNTLVSIILFYTIYLILIPRFLETKQMLHFWLFFALIFTIYPIFRIYLGNAIETATGKALHLNSAQAKFWNQYVSYAIHNFIIGGLSFTGKFTFDWFKNQQIQAELKNQNIKSELALLKSQINPHFLFNTLNNIHTLVYKKSANADQAILKLSDLMRYVLYESNGPLVCIKKELNYIKNYIELEKLRMQKPEQVRVEIQETDEEEKISPMLLIPFIENAFKHSNKNNEKNYIYLSIKIENHVLRMNVENYYEKNNKSTEEIGGIGLKNAKRRLDLIYPNQYKLNTEQTESEYKVEFTLNLIANENIHVYSN